MSGNDVRIVQSALKSRGYLHDRLDGEYGPLTAQAAYRAKYWLGYQHPDHAAGERLLNYLLEKKQPTPAMKLNVSQRRKLLGDEPLRVRALKQARRHLGEKESPAGSNHVPWASDWYGVIGPWCAMAVTRWYVDAGSKALERGHRYAYVPYIVHDARAGANNLTLRVKPSPGDLVCYDWDRDGVADHVGLFEGWMGGASSFRAIEGNTSVGDDSNGGEVMRRTRYLTQVDGFVHVGR